jgi:hypothetical protein
MIKRYAALAFAALVMAGAIPAQAHDHAPPRTKLISGTTEQRGRQGSYCWTRRGPDPDTYEQLCVDMIPGWPDVKRAQAGRIARIRIFKAAAPRDVSVSVWRDVDRNGIPQGDQRMLDYSVEPAMVNGNRVHDVRFRLPRREGHAYLELFATWPDQQGSDTRQDSFFQFHLRLR